MKGGLPSFLVVLAASALAGCGTPHSRAPGAPAFGVAASAAPGRTEDPIGEDDRAAYASAEDAEDAQLARLEQETLTAMRVSRGKEGYPRPASEGVSALRKLHVRMSLEPANDLLQLKVAADPRLDSKIAGALEGVRMQVLGVSVAAVSANGHVQGSSIGNMLRVSSLVRARKLRGVELDAQDIALVRRGLERQRRAETLAAASLAMLAAAQAVINDGGDPRALDVIAEATLDAFPIAATVTDADARAYVDALGPNVRDLEGRYEARMRKTWGDRKYEEQRKAMTAKTSVKTHEATPGYRDPLEASAKALPADTTIAASLRGVSAVRSGDPAGAIDAALSFVHVPQIEDALRVASKILFLHGLGRTSAHEASGSSGPSHCNVS